MPGAKRVTLADIAAQAEVSLTTISKVLNGGADVAPPTRARVEDLLAINDYRRRGGSPRGDSVEVVLAELDAHWSARVVDGIGDVAARHGLTVTLSVSGDPEGPGEGWDRAVLRRRPAGVVFMFRDISARTRIELRARGIRFVVVDPGGDPAPDLPAVGAADWGGGLLAARHLAELGHRSVGVIAGPDGQLRLRARLDGFRAGAAGFSAEAPRTLHSEDDPASIAAQASALLALSPVPTAVFAVSDTRAIGVMNMAHASGIDVPGRLSVIGFDDLDIARLASPPLTTVHRPLHEIGEQAAAMLLSDGGLAPRSTPRVELATSLVLRGSTGPPPIG